MRYTASMLLIILFIVFIGLGLPSALLGSAWPVIQAEWDAPVSYAGIIAMLITGGMVLSVLMADRMVKLIRPGLVVALGVFLMGLAVFGFALANSVWLICLWAVPLGFGSGAVDAVINNYIAVHHTSRHMNWLHCFWALGAMLGPYIMGFYLSVGMPWNYGFGTVGVALVGILIAVFFSLRLWKKPADTPPASSKKGLLQVIRIRGVVFALFAFFGYCALESTAGLWASTYLVYHRGIGVERAALFGSFFFIGITAGRFASGFVSNKLGDRKMVVLGLATVLVGVVAVWFPFGPVWICLAGLIVIGLGCGPVFPALMHATPANFGAAHSQALIGVQMAAAYTGAAFMPMVFGGLADIAGIGFFPVFLFAFLVLTIGMVAGLNSLIQNHLLY
jgi:fucose permease